MAAVGIALVLASTLLAQTACNTAVEGPSEVPARVLPKRMWQADKAHSSIQFRVSHWGVVDVIGWFEDFDILVYSDKSDLSDAVVLAGVRPASVRMPNMEMAKNLVGIFQPDQWPEVTFGSTKIAVKEDWNFEILGPFQLRDVKRPVTWHVRFNGPDEPAVGYPGFTARLDLDRLAFGFGGDETLNNSEQLVLGRYVEVICNIRLEVR